MALNLNVPTCLPAVSKSRSPAFSKPSMGDCNVLMRYTR